MRCGHQCAQRLQKGAAGLVGKQIISIASCVIAGCTCSAQRGTSDISCAGVVLVRITGRLAVGGCCADRQSTDKNGDDHAYCQQKR